MSITDQEQTQSNQVTDNDLNMDKTQPVDINQPTKLNQDYTKIIKPMSIDTNENNEEVNSIKDTDWVSEFSTENNSDNIPPKDTPKLEKVKNRKRKWLIVLAGMFIFVLIVGIGAWFGYQSGLSVRMNQEYNQVAMVAVTQFQLGLEDENAGHLDMARKRYEYVIELDPNFPGVQERLASVMLFQAETNVPTVAPTATSIPMTATPDLRGIEEKYNTAVAYMRANDWDNAINALEITRKDDITYRTSDIDGMFYIALRFRGIQKIANGQLEPGIYDLKLSELFAPLDNSAESYRTWARYYLTGASFWGVDWASVVKIFGEIYPSLPNMIDSTGWTVQERYRMALISYADELVSTGDYCSASSYYQLALNIVNDNQVAETASAVQLICKPEKEVTEEVTEEVTATEQVTEEATAVPTDPPTEAPTEAPTDVPADVTDVPTTP